MNATYVYYLGLGSNLEPATHFSTALCKLQAKFGKLLVWPVITTPPVDIDTTHTFFNTLVVLQSSLLPEDLKHWTNALEIQCGRDRSDPLSSHKDRPLDIDILAQQSQLDLSILEQFKEPYIRAVIAAGRQTELESVGPTDRHEIIVQGQRLGQRTATIDSDHTGGHVMVVEDSVDSLLQSFKAAFYREQSLC